MQIRNDEQLATVVAQVNEGLQAIQDYVGGRNECQVGKVKFPAGFIRTAKSQRTRIAFVRSETLRSNLAYMLMLSDVYLWLLMRTSVLGTAREMVQKAGVFLAGAIVESLTKDFLEGRIGKDAGFKKRTQKLLEDEIIEEPLKFDLDWTWDTRNRMHAFLVEEREWQHYTADQYNRAASAVTELVAALDSARRVS